MPSGAVLATRYFPLSDGGRLMLPIQDIVGMLIDNVTLEGHPVTPHFPVKPALAFAQGVDEIFEAGLTVLMNEVKSRGPAARPNPNDPDATPDPGEQGHGGEDFE